MQPYKPSIMTAFSLFVILFLDGIGMGILFPILNSIIVDPRVAFLPAHYSGDLRNFLYGFVLSVYMVFWFFGSTVLGDLSDIIGRKRALLISLLGSFFGYIISAVGISAHSISLLLLGRCIDGFTAGSQPIAQAAIVDLSTAETKARNLGLILLAMSLGFVFGPLLGGVLSDHQLLSWFGYAIPMYFAAIVSLTNAVLLWVFFKETFTRTKQVRLKLHRAVELFISAFRHVKIKQLAVIYLFFIIGWAQFFTFITLFLLKRYGFTALQNGLYMGLMGCGFSLANAFLVGYFAKRYALRKIIAVTIFGGACLIALVVMIPKVAVPWLIAAPLAVLMAITYSLIITLMSNQVDEYSQGWVMGISGSIAALGFGVVALVSGYVTDYGANIPLISATLSLLVAWGLMMRRRSLATESFSVEESIAE